MMMELINKASETVTGIPVEDRLYTLKEIEALAKEWAIENEATNDVRWIVSGLIAWLAKREREGLG